MNNYKEIVTKAVVGKSKKSSTDNFNVTCENIPSTVLGCWVINHKFDGTTNGNNIIINGTYDVNVWYSYDNDTKTTVATKTYSYTDNLIVNIKENISDGKEVIVRSLKQPTVTNVKINNSNVDLSIDKELACEVVGDTKIRVPVETIIDDYEDITSQKEEINTEDINIVDDYIK